MGLGPYMIWERSRIKSKGRKGMHSAVGRFTGMIPVWDANNLPQGMAAQQFSY
jgi:hypothetical protein